ncbi:hypothetical protein ACFE04_013689 [Oxalis oulophora]
MDDQTLRQQVSAMKLSMLDEKILGAYFLTLETLEDTDNPKFLEDIFTLYLSETTKTLGEIDQIMQEAVIDILKLTYLLQRMRGSSISIAAERMARVIAQTIQCVTDGTLEGTRANLRQIVTEQEILTARLTSYFPVWREAKNRGIIQPDA